LAFTACRLPFGGGDFLDFHPVSLFRPDANICFASASPADSPVRAAAAERNRYYVKPTGSDSDVGTSWGAAFKTLLKAAQVVQAGDEVWVAAGTYQETNTVTIPSGVSFFSADLPAAKRTCPGAIGP
jgi:hypothetical protein